MAKKVPIKMEPNKWKQIGGDRDYTEQLVLGYYDPQVNELQVIQIDPCEGKYCGREATFDLDELRKEYDIEDFGLTQEDLERNGLELLAEIVVQDGEGSPIDCSGQDEYEDEFANFDSALACALGLDGSFETLSGEVIKPERKKVKGKFWDIYGK